MWYKTSVSHNQSFVNSAKEKKQNKIDEKERKGCWKITITSVLGNGAFEN